MKRRLSVILSIILILNLFVFDIPVKADVPVPGYSELKELQQDIENGDNRTLNGIWKVLQPIGNAVGVIMNPIQTIEFIRDIVDPVGSSLPDYPSNGSNDDKANYISNYLIDNTTINDNSRNYTLNQNAKNLINSINQRYIDKVGLIYCHSFDINDAPGKFANRDLYLNTINLIKANPHKLAFINTKTSSYWVSFVTDNDLMLIYSQDYTYNGVHYPKVSFYSASNWNQVNLYNKYPTFKYDNTNNVYVQATDYQAPTNKLVALTGGLPILGFNSTFSNYGYFVSVSGDQIIPVYASTSVAQSESVGHKSYYVNNTVNNNFKNSTGDYTVNNDNSNHATYRNVTNYVDNSITNTGKEPSPNEIEIYIENVLPNNPTPTPTSIPDNPSGGLGSSVSGNSGGTASASATANNSGVNVTVNNNHNINFNVPGLSGNGTGSGSVSGNGNGSSNIFDWISDIGSVIGDFIKNVGELIADVVKGITETITTILADIPNIISVLVEFVYGGLPDELKAIVTLGITTVIFVGVIKMMRK